MALKRVLIMAGGTGGHVFPGLAVAHYLQSQNVEVHWLGTQQGLEARLIPEANLPLHCINISGVRGKGIKTLLLAPLKIFSAILQAHAVLKQVKPDVVIGMGGFVSGPGGAASWLAGYPLIIHEQNAIAGMTNKILQRFSKKVLEAFPGTFHSPKTITVGNPVRVEIETMQPPKERFAMPHPKLQLLVVGGSLGAQALNEIIPKALKQLPKEARPLVIHQTGEKSFSQTKNLYESMDVEVTLQPFIKDMKAAYQWADVVFCRAGALTVSELCAAGLGAIFIPFPYAVDDHQTANADYMVSKNAAYCIQQSDLTVERIVNLLQELSSSPERRLEMATRAYDLRKVRVSEKIFDILSETVAS